MSATTTLRGVTIQATGGANAAAVTSHSLRVIEALARLELARRALHAGDFAEAADLLREAWIEVEVMR